MGYVRHHAIIVTGSYNFDSGQGDPEHWADYAQHEAVRIFDGTTAKVTEVTATGMNSVRSFMVAPDGSKEGWDHSDEGDNARAQFVRWLEAQRYADASSPLAWVEVQFGDDDCETKIVNDSDAAWRLHHG